jgi:NAD(P)-dependent dehydrogenase (short-subunit alcohol dehydrogenase family)
MPRAAPRRNARNQPASAVEKVQLIFARARPNIPNMKSVVVTGASSGIGWGIAKVLSAKGFRVFGSVRNADDAERLCAEFGAHFVPLQFDITDEAAVRTAAREVGAALAGGTLAGLVNNAGISVPGPVLDLTVDEFRHQLEVNLVGQLIVTQAFLPLLGADQTRVGAPGRIVMISSVGGRNGSPFISAYNASKFGLEGFSESLRRELMLFGIDVIIVAPGAVRSAIWEKAEAIDMARYSNSPYRAALDGVRAYMPKIGRRAMAPERVGELVHHVLTTPRPRVRYAIVPNRIEYLISRLLPKRVLDRLIAGRLGLRRVVS